MTNDFGRAKFSLIFNDTNYNKARILKATKEDRIIRKDIDFFTDTPIVISFEMVADTTPPIANAGPDQTVDEDTLVTFDGSASWDNIGIVSYTWTFTDVTPRTLTGVNPTYTFATPGVYRVTLNVTDAAGNFATDEVEITVLDVTAPMANAGPDQTVNEDALATFDGSGSTDNVAIKSYTWTFIEVTPRILGGVNPTYTFKTPDTYTVTLNVTDAAGNYATDTVVITVLDVTDPVADAGPDQTVDAGTTVTFDAGGSTDNVGVVLYEWDFGDGTTGTGVTTTHTYAEPGTYTVTLTVKDAAGNYDTDSLTIIVEEIKVPKPAEFRVTDLFISAVEVRPGETIAISVKVTNVGELKDTYKLTLMVNGQVETAKDMTLAGGTSTPVTFTLTKDTAGTYSIEIDGQTGTLRIIEEAPPPSTTAIEAWLTYIGIAIVAISAISALLIKRRRKGEKCSIP